ncbi:MAG: glycosyl hydrolase 25 family protein [Bacteroidetes bacterium]|nr:glycosyl hydrolase 25 family protein [Bacteroidota bacterium]
MKRLIDISQYQGQYSNGVWHDTIAWSAVAAAGIDGCIIQLTQGLGLINPLAHQQACNARAAGLRIGFYHFGRPNHSDAKAEAQFFLAQIRRNDIPTADIIPALDVEQIMIAGVEQKVPQRTLEQWIIDFCQVLAADGLDRVMLYSNPGYLDSNLSPVHKLKSMPLWLSEYAGSPYMLPKGWNTYALWQNSGTGHVDGIAGNVDTNQCPDISLITL